MRTYKIIGLMSGTSMDGVDLCFAQFSSEKSNWNFEILNTKELGYPTELKKKLSNSTQLSGLDLTLLDLEIGDFFGECINEFIAESRIDKSQVDAIASHGHTVFHQPEKRMTLQIGNGTRIAATCGIPVINDFRSKDVFFGGQGAPLVPIGDRNLFSDQAESFLNIGGFTNISFQKNDSWNALDICAGNLPLNRIMEQSFGLSYDKDGEKAKSGRINQNLLEKLNALPYFNQTGPKSLGTEWLDTEFESNYKDTFISPEDLLSTITEHIAIQIGTTLDKNRLSSVLITGGGAKNEFLRERIKENTSAKIVIPQQEIIDFKEALIFGFLGALYLAKDENILKEITGAERNSCSGVLHLP